MSNLSIRKKGFLVLLSSYCVMGIFALFILLMPHFHIEISTSVRALALLIVMGISFCITIYQFSHSIKELALNFTAYFKRVSQHNFSEALSVISEDDLGQMADSANLAQGEIAKLISGLTEIVGQIATAAEELSTTGQQALEGVNKQRAGTEKLAHSIKLLSNSAHAVSANATAAATSAKEADNEAGHGKSVVEATRQSINTLVQRVQGAANVINRLEEHSKNIGAILDVIRGIAEQTNLLALNAAIEAARAGEQGRGFAVVADEVRTLAQRTQQSTQEIQNMIEKLQSGARQAVEEMDKGKAEAEVCMEQATKADEALAQITLAVSRINDMNNQIASAASEQNVTAGEINHTVTDISAVTDEASNLTQKTVTTSQQLTGFVQQLNSISVNCNIKQ